MTAIKTPLKLVAFDVVRYLDNDEAIADYMTAMLETGDSDVLSMALADVTRARELAQVAKNRNQE